MPGIKHPARHYLNFLLSRRVYDVNAAILAAGELGIAITPPETEEAKGLIAELKLLRRKMAFPRVFNPADAEPNQETLEFLRTWGITEAWRNDSFLRIAKRLLNHTQLRYALEVLLLGPMSPLAIAQRLRARYDLPESIMNAGVVRAYGHYLWDQGAMNDAEWRVYLRQAYADNASEYFAALQAPRSPAGAAFVISVADKDVQLLGAAERYEVASSSSFRAFMHHIFAEPSSKSTYAAFAALNMMKIADGELDKYRGGSVELIEELKRLETVHDRSTPLSIKDMSFMRPVLLVSGDSEPGEEESHD